MSLWPYQSVVGVLLENVARPPGYPAGRKCCRKEIPRQADGVQHNRGVELDVGVQPATRLLLFKESETCLLTRGGKSIEVALIHFLRNPTQNLRSRILRLVHTMTKPHQTVASGKCRSHPWLRVLRRPYRI